MTRKEDILYEAISKDTSIKKVRGFSTTYPSLCNLKLFQNIDGTWLTAQDDIGVSITIKMSDLNDFVHCENLDHNSRWKESEEKMTYKENITAILECCFAGFKQEIIEAACNRILGLKPKTGHWMRMSDLSEQKDDRYECSRCGNVIHHKNKLDLYTFNSWCGRCGSDNGGKWGMWNDKRRSERSVR